MGPAGMLTLWQAMTGGVDWASVVTPLLEPGPANWCNVRLRSI